MHRDVNQERQTVFCCLKDGTRRAVVILLHTYKDVVATEVVEVVGKCADTVIDIRMVPTLFELYPVSFNLPIIQQIFYVDWWCNIFI